MRRYQTEIVITPDRYVGLQLPAHLPEGRAIVTVTIEEPDPADSATWPETDPDHQDIEWWDEFDDAEPDESFELRARSGRR